MIPFDFSTLNLNRLYRCQQFVPSPAHHLQENPGNDCELDPPGYPTYFTRVVYNQHGYHANDRLIITGPNGIHYIVGVYGTQHSQETLSHFWNPVPMDSLRFKHWERRCYMHWSRCYEDDVPDKYGSTIRTGRDFARLYEQIQEFKDDPDHQELFQQCVQQFHSHFAYQYIRRFYPEYQINVEWAIYRGGRAPRREDVIVPGTARTLADGFYYGDQWIAHEVNNRWWERYSDPSVRVGVSGTAYGGEA